MSRVGIQAWKGGKIREWFAKLCWTRDRDEDHLIPLADWVVNNNDFERFLSITRRDPNWTKYDLAAFTALQEMVFIRLDEYRWNLYFIELKKILDKGVNYRMPPFFNNSKGTENFLKHIPEDVEEKRKGPVELSK